MLFERIVNPELLVRTLYLTACHVLPEEDVSAGDSYEHLDLFTDYQAKEKQRAEESAGSSKTETKTSFGYSSHNRFNTSVGILLSFKTDGSSGQIRDCKRSNDYHIP